MFVPDHSAAVAAALVVVAAAIRGAVAVANIVVAEADGKAMVVVAPLAALVAVAFRVNIHRICILFL